MQPGRGADETEIRGGGGEGGHIQVFQRLWVTPRDGDLSQILDMRDLSSGQRLVVGGEELVQGKEGFEEDVAHTYQGGGSATDVQFLFKSVVQAVLLFRSETWVVTPHTGMALGGGGVKPRWRDR